MKRKLAAALPAAVLALGGWTAGCSSSNSGSQAAPASQAAQSTESGPTVVMAPAGPLRDAADACENMYAQVTLMHFAEKDFADAFYVGAPDIDPKRAVFVAAAANAVQQVANGMSSDVPDPPLGVIQTWMDVERALITITAGQQGQVADVEASNRADDAFNAAQLACRPIRSQANH
jgi:hypothetical protein